MKKIALLMIILVMVNGLCSCGIKKEDTPSGKQINEDLSSSFAEWVAGAELISSNKIKNLTNEKKYEITMELLAMEASAEWKYNVDMTYTKYDDGWMFDSVVFDKGVVVKAIIPSKEEMHKIVENFMTVEDWEPIYLANIDWNSISIEDKGNNQFKATWDSIILYKHGKQCLTQESNWSYNAETKMWTITKTDDYQLSTIKEDRVFDYNALLNRDWVSEQGVLINTITVNEFSEEKCVVKWKSKSNTEHELIVSGIFQPIETSGSGDFKFKSCNGMTRKYYDSNQDCWLDITFGETYTTFNIYRNESNHFTQYFYGDAK